MLQGNGRTAARLLGLLKDRHLDPPTVYKAAGIDRRSYSDIVNDEHHPVTKLTAIRFALALHLTRCEADQLLHAAGYSFSRASITDAIFEITAEKLASRAERNARGDSPKGRGVLKQASTTSLRSMLSASTTTSGRCSRQM